MKKNIVIIEDSHTILEVLKFSLEKAGYNVFTSFDQKSILNMFTERNISLLITNLNTTQTDYLELVSQIKKIEKNKNLPVLVLATESQTSKKREAKKAGATGWILKPFVPEKLIREINKLLSKSN